jgi:hypothetical protein
MSDLGQRGACALRSLARGVDTPTTIYLSQRAVLSLLFGCIMVVFGAILSYTFWEESRLAAESDAQPQEISLRDLFSNGFGSNRHVKLTGVSVSSHGVSTKERTFIPLYLADGPQPAGVGPRAVLKVADPRAFQACAQRTGVQGLVLNGVVELDTDEYHAARMACAPTSFADCPLIEEGRQPYRRGTANALLATFLAVTGLGGVSMIAGNILWIVPLVKARRVRRQLDAVLRGGTPSRGLPDPPNQSTAVRSDLGAQDSAAHRVRPGEGPGVREGTT